MTKVHRTTSLHAALPLLENQQAVLFDWDGCLANGLSLTEDARTVLSKLPPPWAVISNQSAFISDDIARVLASSGATAHYIALAGEALLRNAATKFRTHRIMLIATERLQLFAKEACGLPIVDRDPSVVLVLRDPLVRLDQIARAADAIRKGAILVAANPDRQHPGPNGEIVAETGVIANAICFCAGRDDFDYFGKPKPDMLLQALDALAVDPEQAVMVGDNPETDGAAARAAGLDFIQIVS